MQELRGYLHRVPELAQIGARVLKSNAKVQLALDNIFKRFHPLLAVVLGAARERMPRLARVQRVDHKRVTAILSQFHFVHLQRVHSFRELVLSTHTYLPTLLVSSQCSPSLLST